MRCSQARAALNLRLSTLHGPEFEVLWESLQQYIDNERELEGLPEAQPRKLQVAEALCAHFDAVVASLAESEL